MNDNQYYREASIIWKRLLENAVLTEGLSGRTSLINSKKLINLFHEAVKKDLIYNNGIDPDRVIPKEGKTKPELDLHGSLKKKGQDICVIPAIGKKSEVLTNGVYRGDLDTCGHEYTQRTMTINVRSQSSNLGANFDTMFERTYAEAYNFHKRCPNMVLGELYILAVPEYCRVAAYNKQIGFIKKVSHDQIAKFINGFDALNGRENVNDLFECYERVCLIIINFNNPQPKIYTSIDELKRDDMIAENYNYDVGNLFDTNSFIKDLLGIYKERFDK